MVVRYPPDRAAPRRHRLPGRAGPSRVPLAVLAAVVPLVGLAGCAADASAQPAVRGFLLAWQSGHYTEAAALTTGRRAAVAAALAGAAQQLDAAAVRLRMGAIDRSGDRAKAAFHATVDLGENGPPWRYDGRMNLRRVDGRWKVVWSPSVIHPALGPGRRLVVETDTPERGQILDAGDRPLMRDAPVVVVGVRPDEVADPRRTAAALAKVTNVAADRVLGWIRSASPTEFAPLVTLRVPAYERLRGQLSNIAGVRTRTDNRPLTPALAGDVIGSLGTETSRLFQQVGAPYQPGATIGIGGLQQVYQRQLAGTPTVRVLVEDSAGRRLSVLAEWPGTASRPVRTTLDRRVAGAAERALTGLGQPASLVAVRASTGEVLAVADHTPPGAATTAASRGLAARYPPGESFTIVSTVALLDTGLSVGATIPCPPQRTVGGKSFTNRRPGGEVTASFRENFAAACRTAFAGLSRRLTTASLAGAGRTFGFGAGWRLPVPAFAGATPKPADDGQKAAQTIGQGGVVASPLVMALAAGAVRDGTWRPPTLVRDPGANGTVATTTPDPTRLTTLRRLMRAAVRSGTGVAADLPGRKVYGQSGLAPYDAAGGRRTQVSWFVGYRGDLAFAVAVEGDLGADGAAPVAARFLSALR